MSRTWITCVTWAMLMGTVEGQSSGRAVAWFPDGTGLEIYTESTGPVRASSAGQIGIGPGGRPTQDLVNHVVVDNGNTILFAYNLEASHGAEPGTVAIRILPISAATEAGILKRVNTPGWPTFSGQHLPTVAAVRELPSVKIGEGVTLDILYKPLTGEKIYDVLRPIADPSPSPGFMMVTTRSPQEICFKEIAIKVNGKAIEGPPATITGAAARIDIPGHGAYVLTVYEPYSAPPFYTFKAIAHVDGNMLRWAMDGENVEIISQANVLTQAANGVLWVYHDPRYRSQDQPDVVGLRTADRVEWLLPKVKR
jgi:hypothetical protein